MKTDKPKLTERQWEVLERMDKGTRMVVFHGNAWVGGEVNRGDYLWLHTEKLIYLAIYEPHGGTRVENLLVGPDCWREIAKRKVQP